MANSKRKCRFCRPAKYDRPENMVQINGAWFCNIDEATQYAHGQIQVQREKQRLSQKRERLRSDFQHQLELTRVAFNRFISLLDQGKPCISCGRAVCGTEFHAGHFKPVSSHPELRFDPRNVYRQGSGCNLGEKYSSKKRREVLEGYEANLRFLFGIAFVDWLNGPHQPAQYTCQDLADIRARCNAEIRYIKKHGKPSRDWRQLPCQEVA